MKLYAQTDSDRASKGQGGNHHVTTVFTIEHDTKEREEIGRTIVERNKDTFTITHIPIHGDTSTYNVPIKKR